MDRRQVIEKIRSSWKQIYEIDSKNGIICPLCKSGSKKKGTGITGDENHGKPYSLKCWACGFQGDVIDLYQKETGSDFNTAIKKLSERININLDSYDTIKKPKLIFKPVSTDIKYIKQKNIARNSGTQVLKEPNAADFTEYYKKCKEKLTDPIAFSYLLERGIKIETAAEFSIGFDPQSDPAQSGHKSPRIIIPINKHYYIGRSVDPNMNVLYSKMNNKGATPGIFNLDALYKKNEVVFVTEGAFDALSVLEVGYNAASYNSSNNANIFIKLIEQKRPVSKIILCPDNDKAGNIGANIIKDGLERLNLPYYTANISGTYKDANDLLKADREEFKRVIKSAAEKVNKNYIDDFLEKIQTNAYKPYKTGLSFFDNLLGGGVIPQTLLLLMAAPGVGKTTLCQQIAETIATGQKPVVYLNLEMSREQMLAKAISGRLAKKGKSYSALQILQGYSWSSIQRTNITSEINMYIRDIFPYLKYNPDSIGSDLDEILNYLRSEGEKAKSDGLSGPIIILDYLHLISSKASLDIQELIKQAVMGLKRYAINYNTFVIGIVATNRSSSTSGKITLESGRDSSNIEYTADYQLSLNYYDIDQGNISTTDVEKISALQKMPERQMIVRMLKGRMAAAGRSVNLWFNAACNYFFEENEFKPFSRADYFKEDNEPTESLLNFKRRF